MITDTTKRTPCLASVVLERILTGNDRSSHLDWPREEAGPRRLHHRECVDRNFFLGCWYGRRIKKKGGPHDDVDLRCGGTRKGVHCHVSGPPPGKVNFWHLNQQQP